MGHRDGFERRRARHRPRWDGELPFVALIEGCASLPSLAFARVRARTLSLCLSLARALSLSHFTRWEGKLPFVAMG